MNNNNRFCKVCGTEYKYCPTCNDNLANPKPSWYKTFDKEDCKLIFDTAVQVTCGNVSAFEAQKILAKCNLNQTFEEDLQQVVNTIKAAKKPYIKEDIVKDKFDEN